MNDEEDMGEIDKEGFFVFKRNKDGVKDAWLDSLQMGNDEEVIKSIQKKVVKERME